MAKRNSSLHKPRLSKNGTQLVVFYAIAFACAHVAQFSASADTTQAASPQLNGQTVFDQPTVRRLIAQIDAAHNAAFLRAVYFGSHMRYPYSKQAAFMDVCASIIEEPVGTHRWFLLKSVQAYAALRLGEQTRAQGLQAYSDIFARSEDAEKANAVDVLERAIYDYTDIMLSGYGPSHYGTKANWNNTLLAALKAQFECIQRGDAGTYNIRWGICLRAVQGGKDFEDITEACLRDSKNSHNIRLISTAASVEEYLNPERAISIIQQALSSVPAPDAHDAESLYYTLVNCLAATGRFDDAIKAQTQSIALTGHGSARLVQLYLNSRKVDMVVTVLKSLTAADANEGDIIETSAVLLQYADISSAPSLIDQDQGISLLTNYLSSDRKRTLTANLEARIVLAQALSRRNKTGNAITILKEGLSIIPSSATSNNAVRRSIDDINRLLDKLSKLETVNSPHNTSEVIHQ